MEQANNSDTAWLSAPLGFQHSFQEGRTIQANNAPNSSTAPDLPLIFAPSFQMRCVIFWPAPMF